MLANEETADTDFGGVGLDQQCHLGGAGEEAIEKLQVFRRKREPVTRMAAKISHCVCRGRSAGLEPLPAILQSRAVFLSELIRRAAAVFAGDRFKIVNTYNRGNPRADGPDKKTADLGAAFGNRAKAAHHFRGQTVDDVESQVNYHGLTGDLPDVVSSGILCPSLHFSYRFIVLR